jgi:hypothetical protein
MRVRLVLINHCEIGGCRTVATAIIHSCSVNCSQLLKKSTSHNEKMTFTLSDKSFHVPPVHHLYFPSDTRHLIDKDTQALCHVIRRRITASLNSRIFPCTSISMYFVKSPPATAFIIALGSSDSSPRASRLSEDGGNRALANEVSARTVSPDFGDFQGRQQSLGAHSRTV